jgi:hypothetical protein
MVRKSNVNSDDRMTLVFVAKSSYDYPGGRIAFLQNGIVFPELRFTPEIGEEYECDVRFYQKEGVENVIGIAFPVNIDTLTEDEYDRSAQVVIAVTFVKERGSRLIARHPYTGAYIIPTESASRQIQEGVQCWVMLVQRAVSLVAHFVKNVESPEEAIPESAVRAIALRDPSFSAQAELKTVEQYGMGDPPTFHFKGKPQFPWEILSVKKDATVEEIRKSYRRMAPKLHPDHNTADAKAAENFAALAHAHDWMFYRREWIDKVTARMANKPVIEPTPPPKPIAVKTEKPAPPTPKPVPPVPIIPEPAEPAITADTRLDDPILAPIVNGISDDSITDMIAGGVDTLGKLAEQSETVLQDLLGGSKKAKIGQIRKMIKTAQAFISALNKDERDFTSRLLEN